MTESNLSTTTEPYNPWPEYFELAAIAWRNKAEREAREAAQNQEQKPA